MSINQQIVDYLQTNKDQYSKEDLIKELDGFGFSKDDIQLGVNNVYKKSSDINVNTQIVDYLNKNKGEYSKESLVKELEKFGYQEDDIKDSVKSVYSNKQARKSSVVMSMLSVVMFGLVFVVNIWGLNWYISWMKFPIASFLLGGTLLFMGIMGITFFNKNINKKLNGVVIVIYLMYVVFTFFILIVGTMALSSLSDVAVMYDLMMFVSIVATSVIVIGIIGIMSTFVKVDGAEYKQSRAGGIKTYLVVGSILVFMFVGDFVIIKNITVEEVSSDRSRKINEDFRQRQADHKNMAKECSQKIKNIFFLGNEFEVRSNSIRNVSAGLLKNCEEISTYTYYNHDDGSITVYNVNHDNGYKTLRTKVRNKMIKEYKYKLSDGVGDYGENEFTDEHVFRYATNNIDDPYIEYRIGIDSDIDDDNISKILNELQKIIISKN
jgi:DNA-binding transcriptional regulator YhcF (GntR family)